MRGLAPVCQLTYLAEPTRRGDRTEVVINGYPLRELRPGWRGLNTAPMLMQLMHGHRSGFVDFLFLLGSTRRDGNWSLCWAQ
jgi:hypothetical protein